MDADPVYFDSHLHLTDERFDGDRDEVIRRARAAGVSEMVTVASSPGDAASAVELARREEGIWASAGLHPHRARAWSPEVLDRLRDLVRDPDVVAVGETGFDFHYENSPRADQARSFRAHLELAAETGLPVIVHTREADAETGELVRQFGAAARGVLHCFTAGDELLDAALEEDWYVSFSGIATFSGYDGLDRLRRVPGDRLLVETDSPYLSPEPVRGRRNEPAHLPHTVERLARERETEPGELAGLTRRNARRFYRLDGEVSG